MAKKRLKLAVKILVILCILIFLIFRGRVFFWKAINKFEGYIQTKQNEQVLKEIENFQSNQATKNAFTDTTNYTNTNTNHTTPANSPEATSTIDIISHPTETNSSTETNSFTETNSSKEQSTSTETPITETTPKLLKVPFICQAPLQTVENWKFHEESCEEAAVLQTYLYETGNRMTREEADKEILKMVEWQKTNFGDEKDMYADTLKTFISGYYQITESQIEITYDASLEDIKEIINSGHPVIVPIMGDILKNPNYPYPGYHMLVVTGFTEDMIITNDNGTRKGESYSYPNERFLKAMQAAGGDIVTIEI